jgi:hypothetical protein
LKRFLLTPLFLISITIHAQFQYKIDQSAEVEINGSKISMPWAGGLNSAQINTMDLNGDSHNDLVIYDKGVGKIWTFLQTEKSYRYAPEFESLFPPNIQSFILLRDYNCDGKKDLFTFNNSINGISVYKNVTSSGGKISWQQIKIYLPTTKSYTEILLTQGFSGLVNVLPGIDDIPNIADMDGDGDLDILNMRFVNPSTAEFHRNLSKETYGVCDSLIFKRETQRWGGWEECTCGQMAFGTECTTSGRTEHTGGKSLLTLDIDADGDLDVLYSEEKCSQLYLLPNQGTGTTPLMNSITVYPTSNPIYFPFFPSPFLEDVDFDGIGDLIISSNINVRTVFNTDFNKSLWLYKNTATSSLPKFTLIKQNFLQESMIDVGDNSVPAFFDYDGDGDQDMFIGTFTSDYDDFTGRIFQYENTGTKDTPVFSFITDNFGSIDLYRFYNVKLQFTDIDGNGTIDLTFTATTFSDGVTSVYIVLNKNKDNGNFDFSNIIKANFNLGADENVCFVDVNRNGVADILVGRSTGALQYYENLGAAGTFNFALTNQTYLNLGITTARQNLSVAVGDLNADGNEDLVTGDQRGFVTIYDNFRSANTPEGITDIVYDSMNNIYAAKNMGGRVWPTISNLFNGSKPSIIIGNTAGGLSILKNEDDVNLSDTPVISLSPNPVPKNQTLNIKADRNVSMQIFSLLGQRMSEPIFIPANQEYQLSFQNIFPGLYIARFTVKGKNYARKFVIE